MHIIVAGDNLDIYVKTSHLSKDKSDRDLHLFTSNIIFSRVASVDMSNIVCNVDTKQLHSEDILMTDLERARFMDAYSILLVRVLCSLPAFRPCISLVPRHISHEYSQKMSSKSYVFPLSIIMKNESKHEDCMAIMGSYEEQLISLYRRAFGKISLLMIFVFTFLARLFEEIGSLCNHPGFRVGIIGVHVASLVKPLCARPFLRHCVCCCFETSHTYSGSLDDLVCQFP